MSSFENGVRKAVPVCFGLAAVGVAFGLAAAGKGLTAIEAAMMSLLVMAGSSQFFALSLFLPGGVLIVPPMVVIVGTFLINLRHLVMSVYTMNRLKKATLNQKLWLSYALCDESFVLFSQSRKQEDDAAYLAGINAALHLTWTLSTFVGALCVALVPPAALEPLGMAIYAAFVSLLIPEMQKSLRIVAVVLFTMFINTMLTQLIPVQGLAVVLSMLVGAGFGSLLPENQNKQPEGRKKRT